MPASLPETARSPSAQAQRDHRLVEAALAHDEKAYAELLRHYEKSLFHLILKIVHRADDAEDLTQESFVKAFRNLPKFNPEYAFSTWLFRIGTNSSIDFLRRQRLPTTSLHAPLPGAEGKELCWDFMDHGRNPQEALLHAEKLQTLRRAVGLLPSRYRVLVGRRYFDECSLEELAVEFNRPVGTVKAQLFRARELLYELLAQTDFGL